MSIEQAKVAYLHDRLMLESGTRYAAPMFQGLAEGREIGGVIREMGCYKNEKIDEWVSIERVCYSNEY